MACRNDLLSILGCHLIVLGIKEISCINRIDSINCRSHCTSLTLHFRKDNRSRIKVSLDLIINGLHSSSGRFLKLIVNQYKRNAELGSCSRSVISLREMTCKCQIRTCSVEIAVTFQITRSCTERRIHIVRICNSDIVVLDGTVVVCPYSLHILAACIESFICHVLGTIVVTEVHGSIETITHYF